MNQRLNQYLKARNISQAELSRLLHVSRSAVSAWFNGKAEEIPARKVIRIIEIYKDLNARWLITGDGEMLDGEKTPDIIQKPIEDYGKFAQLLVEKSEECGRLKERNLCLLEEIQKLKGDSDQGQHHQKSRTG